MTAGREQSTSLQRQEQDRKEPGSAGANWLELSGKIAFSLAIAGFAAFLSLPLIALLLRVPLPDLFEYIGKPLVRDALLLSLFTSLASLVLMIAFGTPLAFVLARRRFPGSRVLDILIDLPLVLPPAVAGIALLLAFGRRGLLGPLIEGSGIELAFSTTAVILAQIFVASPFYIKSARSAFQDVPRDLEESASTEGAGVMARFRHIILPLALPGLTGGAIMAWARALSEFGATILFAGNFEGRTQTMPLAIYTALETDLNAAIVLSAVLLIASLAILITFRLLSNNRTNMVGFGQ